MRYNFNRLFFVSLLWVFSTCAFAMVPNVLEDTAGLDSSQTQRQQKKIGREALVEKRKEITKFKIRDWRDVFNKSFASVLGATGPNNQIGNYATLDPISGSIALKGSVPIDLKNKNINFLTFSLKGSLLSDNSTKLLEDSKVNTNSSIRGEYHFFVKVNPKSILVRKGAEAAFNIQKKLLDSSTNKKLLNINQTTVLNKIQVFSQDTIEARLQLIEISKKITLTAVKIATLLKRAPKDICRDTIQGKCEEYYADSLSKLTKQHRDLVAKQDSIIANNLNINRKLDSLTLVLKDWDNMKIFLSNEITKERTKKFEKIKDSTLIDGFRISWFTAVGSIGKSKIFLYKPTITFADQIKDQQIFDNSFGLAWNTYFKSGLQNQTWLINLGVLRSLGNNSDTLSTTDVLEEYSYKNAKGDTTRKVSQKYSAYSDEIFHKREVITYLNVYYIFGQNSNGLHFFSTYFKPDKKTGYYSTGVGYLLSFKPQKKELPLINTETYFTANDLFGSQTSKKLLGRGEIGIRFTFPFNLL